MKIHVLLVGIYLFILPSCINGQKPAGPLKPGDPVPNLKLENIVNYPNETARLADFEDKLLILDFWATWCHPCVEAIPRFEKLQHEFGDQLQILMVTSQPTSSIAQFFADRDVSLPSVTADTCLSKLFPHNYVPHEVWIKDGKVFAVTSEAEVTADNIKTLLTAQKSPFAEKKSNFDYDLTRPLLIDGNGGANSDLQYHSVITGYLDGIGGGGVYTDSLDRYKIRALNGTVLQLYRAAIRYQNKLPLAQSNRSVLEVDKATLLPPPNAAAYSSTARDYYHSYELIVPPALKAQAGKLMLDDLNRYFSARYNIHGVVEKRKVKCWVLKQKGSTISLISQSPSPSIDSSTPNRLIYYKQPFENFYRAVVNLYSDEPYPVIDRTGITSEIDIAFPTDQKDIRQFGAYLNRHGLDLEQELCEIDMLVIKPLN